jgi:hypothetical protein
MPEYTPEEMQEDMHSIDREKALLAAVYWYYDRKEG